MSINTNHKIAVTGGTGFLGSHILRALIVSGYSNVFALKRQDSDLSLVADITDQISWIEGNVLDIASLHDLLDGAHYVIHSAAKVSYVPKHRNEVFNVNVEGTANVVNVALGEKVLKKFIFVSSVAAIGRASTSELIDEKTEWDDDQEHTNYGLAKHMAELEVWRGMTEGLKIGIINPSMILGPSFWGDSSTKLFTYAAKEKKFYPTGVNGFVDVRDVAAIVLKYLESEIVNERVIAVGEMSSYKDLLNMIAAEMGANPPTKALSAFLAKIVWRLNAFKQDPEITKETVSITSGSFVYDNSKSKKLFDFTYRTLKSSVADTVMKFKESQAKKTSFAFFEKIFD